jgi:hypothetical protein
MLGGTELHLNISLRNTLRPSGHCMYRRPLTKQLRVLLTRCICVFRVIKIKSAIFYACSSRLALVTDAMFPMRSELGLYMQPNVY